MTICMSVRHEHWNMHIISALPDSVDEAWATRHFGALDVPDGKKPQSNVAIDSLLINHSFMLTLCKTERVVGLPFTKSCLQFVGDKKVNHNSQVHGHLNYSSKRITLKRATFDRVSGRWVSAHASVVGTVKSANILPYIRWEPFLQTTSTLRCRSWWWSECFFLPAWQHIFVHRFPEMRVSPNHPLKNNIFHDINHPAGGSPIFLEPPYLTRGTPHFWNESANRHAA